MDDGSKSGHVPRVATKVRTAAAKERFERSAAGEVLRRVTAADVINQAFILAALLMLCALPFLILVGAIRGADAVGNLVHRMGLSGDAADDVQGLFAPSSNVLSTTSAGSALALALFALSVAAVLKEFYLRVFDVPARDAGALWRIPAWVVGAIVSGSALAVLNAWLADVSSALVPIADIVFAGAFGWATMHFLLEGARTWRYLFPAALATAACFAGLRLFSSIFFSSMIVSNKSEYGQIGVVFILMYWLIAVGVVLLLGAILGVVWRERRTAPAT